MFERYRFWECKQQEGETIDQFITELTTRAKSCKFGEQHDSMIRDRIVFGVRGTRLKERLLRESSELTLEKAANICRAGKASTTAGALYTKSPVTSLRTVFCTFISLATSLSGLKVRWFDGSVVRWIAGSMDRWFDGSMDRWFSGSLVRWIVGSMIRWFDGLVVQWFADSMVRWIAGSMDRWFDGSLV